MQPNKVVAARPDDMQGDGMQGDNMQGDDNMQGYKGDGKKRHGKQDKKDVGAFDDGKLGTAWGLRVVLIPGMQKNSSKGGCPGIRMAIGFV